MALTDVSFGLTVKVLAVFCLLVGFMASEAKADMKSQLRWGETGLLESQENGVLPDNPDAQGQGNFAPWGLLSRHRRDSSRGRDSGSSEEGGSSRGRDFDSNSGENSSG